MIQISWTSAHRTTLPHVFEMDEVTELRPQTREGVLFTLIRMQKVN